MRANISVHEPRQPQDLTPCLPSRWKVTTSRPRTVRSAVCLGARLELPAGVEQIPDEVGGKLRFGDPGVRLFETSKTVWITSPAYRHASSRRTGKAYRAVLPPVWQR